MEQMYRTLRQVALVAGMGMALASCKKEDPVTPGPGGPPPPPLEQELITTVRLTFTSTDGTEVKEWLWRDLDGDGGDPPVIEAVPLTTGLVYAVSIQLLDESDPNDVEDITEEIEEEDDEHQFFFIANNIDATIAYADADGDGNPIGLQSIWTCGAPGLGTLTLILRHELDKDAPGVSDGDITNAGGDTDVEITFPFRIE
jgi:hypothetical protein